MTVNYILMYGYVKKSPVYESEKERGKSKKSALAPPQPSYITSAHHVSIKKIKGEGGGGGGGGSQIMKGTYICVCNKMHCNITSPPSSSSS